MYRCLVWISKCCVPDGCYWKESISVGLLCDELVHRLDPADGGLPGLAVVRGQVPPGAGSGAGDLHISGLHP